MGLVQLLTRLRHFIPSSPGDSWYRETRPATDSVNTAALAISLSENRLADTCGNGMKFVSEGAHSPRLMPSLSGTMGSRRRYGKGANQAGTGGGALARASPLFEPVGAASTSRPGACAALRLRLP